MHVGSASALWLAPHVGSARSALRLAPHVGSARPAWLGLALARSVRWLCAVGPVARSARRLGGRGWLWPHVGSASGSAAGSARRPCVAGSAAGSARWLCTMALHVGSTSALRRRFRTSKSTTKLGQVAATGPPRRSVVLTPRAARSGRVLVRQLLEQSRLSRNQCWCRAPVATQHEESKAASGSTKVTTTRRLR